MHGTSQELAYKATGFVLYLPRNGWLLGIPARSSGLRFCWNLVLVIT